MLQLLASSGTTQTQIVRGALYSLEMQLYTYEALVPRRSGTGAPKMDELDPSHWGNDTDTIRKKLKELHKYMVKAVTTTYDCQQRKIAQEYDKNSIPHYPNTPPPEQPLEKIVALHSVGFVPEEEEEEEGEE
ncbi:unnamed protein product [Sphagnum balticum]